MSGPGTGAAHYLLPSKDYVVGRKSCDVLLPNDQSISRVHAHLSAGDQVRLRDRRGVDVWEKKLTRISLTVWLTCEVGTRLLVRSRSRGHVCFSVDGAVGLFAALLPADVALKMVV